MASLTKLMTSLIILDENQLTDVVTVNKLATEVEPAKMSLIPGEKITVKELLKGIFTKSANDAAMALALYNSPSIEDFAAKMNKKALEMGLNDTHFVNPVGFDDPGQYSTAQDLATLARAVYKKPIIQKLATLKEADASSVDGKQTHHLTTTNDLLGSYLHILGLKTGTTDAAGQCLISIVENQNGNKILNVMLGSNDRFKETKILSQWLFDSVNWI
jgi:D-alanyl-D-alanine carboxypeptidase (penicillin-binding protein 5/6)